MKVKFLKKFRKRFSIKYTEPDFFPVRLIDHKLKTTDVYSSISYAVAYGIARLLGYNTFHKYYERIQRRNKTLEYFESIKNANP